MISEHLFNKIVVNIAGRWSGMTLCNYTSDWRVRYQLGGSYYCSINVVDLHNAILHFIIGMLLMLVSLQMLLWNHFMLCEL